MISQVKLFESYNRFISASPELVFLLQHEKSYSNFQNIIFVILSFFYNCLCLTYVYIELSKLNSVDLI
jgi:hypothetical protein